MAHLYRLYGQVISSDVALPTSRRAIGKPRGAKLRFFVQPRTRFPTRPRWYHIIRFPDGGRFMAFAKHAEGYQVRCHGIDFLLSSNGERILAGGGDEWLPGIFLDYILPLALSLGGAPVLHASGIATRNGAIAFLGPSGAGKSTLAEAFLRHGGGVLADDALVLRARGKAILPLAGPSHLRLFRDRETKHRVPQRAGGSAPLRAILLLDRGGRSRPGIEPISGAESWRVLLRHSFRLALDEPARLMREMQELHHVVTHVPVRRLRYPSGADSLREVVERVGSEYNIFK